MSKIITVILFLAALAGAYFIFTQLPASVEDFKVNKAAPVASPTPDSSEVRASFLIFIHGLRRTFTDPVYYHRSEDVFIDGGDTAIIHVARPGVTWQDFFKSLQIDISDQCLGFGSGQRYCSGGLGTLRFILNGQETPNLLEREIHRGDRALITLGREGITQIQIQFIQVPYLSSN